MEKSAILPVGDVENIDQLACELGRSPSLT